ncbi:MAG TPA: hypothetical protein PLD79_06715 [Halothiobacillus sp.]|nr:MAG: hypothetical protein B7Z82_04215 [Halothiobacillus sp. 20-54-6]HQT43674.1 hypothetical protein [Halothiobacillus sp.]
MNNILITVHSLAATLWIGGIFFAFMILRPISAQLEPPTRLRLWVNVFRGFFPWVWGFIALLVASGYADLIVRFGLSGFYLPRLLAMQIIGWIMILLFAYLHTILLRRFAAAVDAAYWTEAATVMVPIRRIMATNLFLGLLLIPIGIA